MDFSGQDGTRAILDFASHSEFISESANKNADAEINSA